MTPMPNAARRWATSTPIRPRPRMPTTLSCSSTPVYAARFHWPAFSEAAACGTFRATESSRATACSAALTMLEVGAFTTMTPALVAATTSTLSRPTPARAITRRRGACARASASIFVALRIITASASASAGSSMLRSAPSAYLTSNPDSSWAIPAGESSSATKTIGKDTALPARRRSVWQSDGRTGSRASQSVGRSGQPGERVLGSSIGPAKRGDQQPQSTEACEILHELPSGTALAAAAVPWTLTGATTGADQAAVRIAPVIAGQIRTTTECAVSHELGDSGGDSGIQLAGMAGMAGLGSREARLALLPRRRPARHTWITSRTRIISQAGRAGQTGCTSQTCRAGRCRVTVGAGADHLIPGARRHLKSRHRPGNQVSLAEAAAHLAQQVQLFRPLDTLRHDLDAQVMPDPDDRARDHGQGRVLAKAGHEGRVDLDDVHGKLPEVGERRMARAEIIDGEPDAGALRGRVGRDARARAATDTGESGRLDTPRPPTLP